MVQSIKFSAMCKMTNLQSKCSLRETTTIFAAMMIMIIMMMGVVINYQDDDDQDDDDKDDKDDDDKYDDDKYDDDERRRGRGASSPADLTLGICHDGNFAPVSRTICHFED